MIHIGPLGIHIHELNNVGLITSREGKKAFSYSKIFELKPTHDNS